MRQLEYFVVTCDRALDGGRLATARIDGEPRPMLLGLARPATLEPRRVIAGFVEHCRAQLSESGGR
ncbi:MAG TPA: hypothetical protein VFW09_07705 [Solirubrobacteraceae bacterium]|nr:hypothetical protein [Solirubrobacteraceae bacterium]